MTSVYEGKLRHTPTCAAQQEPIKSARKAKSFRLVSDGFVPRSRTVTRTILAHQALSPFGQTGLLVEVTASRPRSLSGFPRGRRGLRERLEAKVVSAVRAEHDSVGHLLECRCTAATSEVLEALRERASRSIEEADVIQREGLAGFAAPLDSYWRVAAHDRDSEGRNWREQGALQEGLRQQYGSTAVFSTSRCRGRATKTGIFAHVLHAQRVGRE
jgi:hypothetical protein